MKLNQLYESEYCDVESWKYKHVSSIMPKRILKFIKTRFGIAAILDIRTDGSYVFGGTWKSPTDWTIKK